MRLRVLELPICRAAARARRPAHRASVGLPSRRAVARRARGRARGRLGRGAPARPRLHHRRPALAARAARRELARCSTRLPAIRTSCSATTTSRSRATRSRGRSSSAQLDARDAARRLGRRGRAARQARRARRRRPALVARTTRGSGFARLGRRPADPALPLPGARSTGCRAGPLAPDPRRAPARRPDRAARTASAGCCSRIRAPATRRGSIARGAHDDARLARARDDIRAVSLLRPARGDRARSTIAT